MMQSDEGGVAGARSRDAGNWAESGPVFHAAGAPPEALNWLEGREVTGPLRGFGPLWQKTYAVALTGAAITPQEVIRTWKERFPTFWPPGNHFYKPLTGIAPGEVALINADLPGGLRFSTGVMVLYADEEQFTFTTPQGHIFAGWVTFSAFARDGQTVAQVEVLVRSPDPLMELGLRLGGYRQEDRFWAQTLGQPGRAISA